MTLVNQLKPRDGGYSHRMTTQASLRVVLADDHDLIRDGLQPYLERLADVVEVLEATTFQEVVKYAQSEPPIGLILLDLQMPGMNGAASVADVCKVFPGIPVVVISGSSDNNTITAALGFGASGFIPKTTRGKSLVAALKMVLSGENYVPPLMLRQGFEQSDHPLSKLSGREAATLRLLMGGKTNKEIARDMELQEITVKVHLRSIFRKIGAANRTDAVRIAMLQGWS